MVLAGALAVRMTSRLLNPRRLDDQCVFITGGSRGLGLAIARECARRGANIVICGRDRERLEHAAASLREQGAAVLGIACDIRDGAQIEQAIAQASAHFGRLDVLINNAGTIAVGPMDTMTRADYEDALATHFWAMYQAVEAARIPFDKQRRGRIVNVTSIGGKISVPYLLPYCVSKFAAVGYSEGLRARLARDHISVTTVVPGLMRTGSPRNALFKGQHQKEYAWFMLSDSLPGASIAARNAARRIVDGMLRGEAEIVLSLPAQLAVILNGIVPGFVSTVMQLAERVLPGVDPGNTASARGRESESSLTASPLTALSRKAERDYNQI